MHHDLSLKEIQKMWHGSVRSYAIGFVASLILTSASFSVVLFSSLEKSTIIPLIALLALVQAVFQMIFFLHLGKEDSPRWESLIFFLMLILLLIIALGTLWIMHDLNARTMMEM